MKHQEVIENTSIEELVKVLGDNDISISPKYCGFGHEVYENKDNQVQVIYNCRGGNRQMIIHRGF